MLGLNILKKWKIWQRRSHIISKEVPKEWIGKVYFPKNERWAQIENSSELKIKK